MSFLNKNRKKFIGITFIGVFSLSVLIYMVFCQPQAATANPIQAPHTQSFSYAGSDSCAQCHEEIHNNWMTTFHANAFSSPIFQRDWTELSSQTSCLECHTTGFNPTDGTYVEEGVTCESCHGAFDPRHPGQPMSVTPDAELCRQCHKTTTDEWKASPHHAAEIQCQACHDPHSQTPLAESVTLLCTNCHKDMGDSFTHGTHANAGLECSNCHMYTPPREGNPIMGLVPTGHTFTVGSEACIGCHQDTVHTRDELVKLEGAVPEAQEISINELEKTVQDQSQLISSLQTSAEVRLYTGLVQGAIIGLITGGAAAWVVSKRITVIEEDEE